MSQFQIRVDSPEGALLALSHGADGVHVEDELVADAIIAAVAGRVPVSVRQGSDEVLVGDAGGRVRVIGLDGLDPGEAARLAAEDYSGVVLDAGQGTRILDRTDIGTLARAADVARDTGLSFGLSGGLEPPDIPRLLLLAPDMLRLNRQPLRADQIDALRALIPIAGRRPAHEDELDPRRRAARRDEGADRVFVRDFVLPMHIGAYAREYHKTQRVRFDVEVRVLRQAHAPAGMADVFSYDIITDLIRMMAAREHVALVEGLAESIASGLLAYPRVASVTVRIEKLDAGPGGLGVEITRERPAEAPVVARIERSAG